MELEQKSLRVGAAAIGAAIILRLFSGGLPGTLVQFMTSPQMMSVMLYLETGRVVQAPAVQQQPQKPAQPQTEPEQPQPKPPAEQNPPQEPVKAVFSEQDADLVEINNVCGYKADIPTLLTAPLSWDLTQEGPRVLIVHTHATESYTKTEEYTSSSEYRTLDTRYNVVSVGAKLAELLKDGGVEVLHDHTLHDYPSYNGSYENARATIQNYLKKYPTIEMVIDLHRDAVEDADGDQYGYSISSDGKKIAQLMMVVGTDAGGLTHKNWQDNLSLAAKLHTQLEKQTPGICRPISFRTQRFNQDLSAGAVLVEVGAAGNTRQEAMLAAERLAEGILALAHGSD